MAAARCGRCRPESWTEDVGQAVHVGADYRASEHNPHIWIVSGPAILLGLDVLAVFMRPLLIANGPWHAQDPMLLSVSSFVS